MRLYIQILSEKNNLDLFLNSYSLYIELKL